MFKIFEMLADYDRERLTNEKFNEKEGHILQQTKVEEEDAEQLLNEIDLEFEANFDSNLMLLGHLRRDSQTHNT